MDIVTDDALIGGELSGAFVLSARAKQEKTGGREKWEAIYGHAGMEAADCVGVEPGVRLASPSVSSYLGQPDSRVTDANTHTHKGMRTSPSTVSYWQYRAAKAARRRDAPRTVSQFDRRPGTSALRLAGWAAGTQLLSH